MMGLAVAASHDVVVLVAGPAGEVAVNVLLEAGGRVALVEAGAVGRERANRACIPSKTPLRASEPKRAAARTAGVGSPLAGEWIHQAVLAIRAEVPEGTVARSPSSSGAFATALCALPGAAR